MTKFNKDLVSVVEEIPPTYTPFAELRSAKYGSDVEGFMISSSALKVWTHWWGGRTVPHYGDKSQCEPCQNECGKRFKAYFPLYQFANKKIILAEVTHFACKAWEHLLKTGGPDLRGAWVKAIRCSRAHNSRMRVEINQKWARLEGLPEPFDALAVLVSIWNGEAPRQKAKAPQPARPEEIPL